MRAWHHVHQPDRLTDTIDFLKQARWELREWRRVELTPTSFSLFDVNGDFLRIDGIGYDDAEVVTLLRAVNAAYDPETLQTPSSMPKEYFTGRRHPWANDRAM